MKSTSIVEIIKERFAELKMSAEYLLQLGKIVELEYKFTKEFSKDKWKEYFNLDLEKAGLHEIETNELLDFAIAFLKEIKF